jgi:hypothetical protein
MAEASSPQCAGGGLDPTRRLTLPTAGDVGECAFCHELLVLDERGLIPRHYRPGERGDGHESVVPGG